MSLVVITEFLWQLRSRWRKMYHADISAGSTTMGPFISATFFMLLHSPAKLDRLVQEIRSLPSEDEIRIGGKLDECIYLWACIDEVFRLMPNLTNPLFRAVQPGGVVINDKFFDKGIDLGCSIFEIHRNRKYFHDPHAFLPERYLGSSDEERKEAKKFWVPFSRGNRACVGPALAYMVIGQTIAKTIWQYDMRLAPESCCGDVAADKMQAHHEFDSFVGLRTKGPLVQVRRR